jgi:hypothetical protein
LVKVHYLGSDAKNDVLKRGRLFSGRPETCLRLEQRCPACATTADGVISWMTWVTYTTVSLIGKWV